MIHVESYQATGSRLVHQWVRRTAGAAVAVVEQHFATRLAPVSLVLTDDRGLAELADRAEREVVPGAAPASREDEYEMFRRAGRVNVRVTLHPQGGTQLLLNTKRRALLDPERTAVLVAHGLVHCEQIGRPGVREQVIASIRHDLLNGTRLAPLHEREACQLEKQLAKQFL